MGAELADHHGSVRPAGAPDRRHAGDVARTHADALQRNIREGRGTNDDPAGSGTAIAGHGVTITRSAVRTRTRRALPAELPGMMFSSMREATSSRGALAPFLR